MHISEAEASGFNIVQSRVSTHDSITFELFWAEAKTRLYNLSLEYFQSIVENSKLIFSSFAKPWATYIFFSLKEKCNHSSEESATHIQLHFPEKYNSVPETRTSHTFV
jgi:hypothetical protein